MIRIEHSIVIQRPAAEVFAFVTNFENDRHWWKAVSHTDKITPDPMGVGTEFRQVARVMDLITVHNHLTVLEYAPPDYVRYVNHSPQLPYTLLYRFTPATGGTTFALQAELAQQGLLRLLWPLLMRSLRGQLQTYFALLKTHLESRAS